MLSLGDGFGTCELAALFAFSPSPLRKAESVDGTTRLLGVRGALVAGLLLAVVVLVLTAGSADAAFPGQNGKIAFVKENFRNGGSDIFAIEPDGSGQERLGSENGYSPSWSADGQKVVFVAPSGETEREFNQDVYVMNADGSNVERVTDSRAYESSPSFFPDGETIAFARYSERNGSDIFTMKLDGTGSTKLTDDPGFYEETVAVSPTGDRIAYSRYNRSSDIFVMNADGSNLENITKTGRVDEFGTDWSPDGTKLAFTSYRFIGFEGGLAAQARDGGTFAPEALGPESLAREASDSKAAPDEPQEDVEVAVINADGSGRENLTASRAYDASPAFSPDGKRIVFSKMTFDAEGERSELFAMRADGTNKGQLTDTPRAFEYEADWQPIPEETAELD
jgi:TolB protein